MEEHSFFRRYEWQRLRRSNQCKRQRIYRENKPSTSGTTRQCECNSYLCPSPSQAEIPSPNHPLSGHTSPLSATAITTSSCRRLFHPTSPRTASELMSYKPDKSPPAMVKRMMAGPPSKPANTSLIQSPKLALTPFWKRLYRFAFSNWYLG